MPNADKAQFKTEGQPAFPVENTEENNSADSPTDQDNTDSTQSSEGDENSDDTDNDKQDGDEPDNKEKKNQNIADHPRWKERENDWKERFNDQEKRHAEELQRIREEFDQKLEKKQPDNSKTEVPSWWGGDEDSYRAYQADQDARINKAKLEAKEEALKELSGKTEKEQNAIKEATDYMNEEISKIESDKTLNPKGVKVDKAKLLKIVLDNELVDTKGRWNYRAGWRMLNTSLPTKDNSNIDEKKKLADATTDNKGGTPEKPIYVTSDDFSNPSNRPW